MLKVLSQESFRVVHGKNVDRGLLLQTVFVDADDLLLAGVDAGLLAGRSLLDAHLRNAGLDGLGHTAQLLDLLDALPGFMGDLVGQRLDVVGTCPRVDLAADVGLLLNVDLRVTRNTRREVGRQGDRLVQGVGVQRLGVSQRGAHGLDGRAGHVVPFSIDIVDVFRRSELLPDVAYDFLETDATVFWSQIGLENEEAETILRQANRQDIVMNRCTKREYMRLFV